MRRFFPALRLLDLCLPLQLLPEVDSGRFFKLTYLSFIGKGASGIDVVLYVQCPLEARECLCETWSCCVYLCTSTLQMAVAGETLSSFG